MDQFACSCPHVLFLRERLGYVVNLIKFGDIHTCYRCPGTILGSSAALRLLLLKSRPVHSSVISPPFPLSAWYCAWQYLFREATCFTKRFLAPSRFLAFHLKCLAFFAYFELEKMRSIDALCSVSSGTQTT